MLKALKDIQELEFNENNYLRTGFPELDRTTLGFGKGQLIVLTGTRGGGKATLSQQIVLNFTQRGYRGIAYSLEMPPSRSKKWYLLQACETEDLVSFTSSSGKELWKPRSDEIKQRIVDWVGDKFLLDDNETYNAKAIETAVTKQLNTNAKIDYVLIDNLMRMDIGDFGTDKWQAQTKLTKSLQKLCQEKNVCLILVAHPNKVKTLPRIEDVGGSGDIVNLADMVLIMHKVTTDFKARAMDYFGWGENHEAFSKSNIIEVAKDREFGNEGKLIGLYFDERNKRFMSAPHESVRYGWNKELKQSTFIAEDEADGNLPF